MFGVIVAGSCLGASLYFRDWTAAFVSVVLLVSFSTWASRSRARGGGGQTMKRWWMTGTWTCQQCRLTFLRRPADRYVTMRRQNGLGGWQLVSTTPCPLCRHDVRRYPTDGGHRPCLACDGAGIAPAKLWDGIRGRTDWVDCDRCTGVGLEPEDTIDTLVPYEPTPTYTIPAP